MKRAKLILLENPIIVTDEEIKEGDNFYYKHFGDDIVSIADSNTDLKNANTPDRFFKKIISTNKQIDYNDIDFGIVDLDKLAEDSVQEVKPNNTDFFVRDVYKEFFIEGFKASQQLNENKFTLEEISTYFIGGNKKGSFFDDYLDYRLETNDKISFKEWFIKANAVIPPKTFDIEIEETPTNIKIIKKL